VSVAPTYRSVASYFIALAGWSTSTQSRADVARHVT
jgi:hypothetical protein